MDSLRSFYTVSCVFRPWQDALLANLHFWVDYKRPMGGLVYLFLYHFFGVNPLAYYLTGLILTSLNLVLAFTLLQRITKRRFLTVTAVALAAIHPAYVAVWYNFGTVYESLALGLMCASFHFYLNYLDRGGKSFLYAIRLPANEVLQGEIEHLLTRPVGRPPRKPIVWFADFQYQAASWDWPRRVIAKVEWHREELFPRVGFIVTNMSARAQGVVHFYNGRGTAEQWIKEGKYALNWTRLSCQHFVPNQVRLALFVLAYNLGNFLRRLVLPRTIKHWSLRSLLTKLIKIGAKVVRHSRIVTFQMAEVAISKDIWAELLSRIDRLRWMTV